MLFYFFILHFRNYDLPPPKCICKKLTYTFLICASIFFCTVITPQSKAQVIDQRVRVMQKSGLTSIGQVTEVKDSIFVVFDERSAQFNQFSYNNVDVLSTSLGTRSHVKDGILYGALAGSAMFLAFCIELVDLGACGFDGATIGTFIGTNLPFVGIGALVGFLIKSERWVPIPIRGQTAVRFQPTLNMDFAGQPVFGVRVQL